MTVQQPQPQWKLTWSSKRSLTTNKRRTNAGTTTNKTGSGRSETTATTIHSKETISGTELQETLRETANATSWSSSKRTWRSSRRILQRKERTHQVEQPEDTLHTARPQGGRHMLQGIPRQASIRDLSKYQGVVDASLQQQDEPERELTEDETHRLIPGMLGFQSAHTLINHERMTRGRARLHRSVYLDNLCVEHARKMARASNGVLMHSVQTTAQLKELVGSDHAGENIQRGPSVRAMHAEAMSRPTQSAFKNIMGEKFTEFGMGTAVGKDGKLYMAQLFRGKSNQDETPESPETPSSPQFLSEFLERASFWTTELMSSFLEEEEEEEEEDSETSIAETEEGEPGLTLFGWSPLGKQQAPRTDATLSQ